jgi:hypothetical protein
MTTETLRWIGVNCPPDDATTVLVLLPPAASEPSWLGWFDSAKNTWRDACSGGVLRLQPTHWADLPQGDAR